MYSFKKNSTGRLIIGSLLIITASCNQIGHHTIPPSIKQTSPTMTFNETYFNFGMIQSGDTVMHVFKFKNTGKGSLIISDISASCGCTVVEWPKKPIMPDQSSQIKITFSKRHDPGIHQKIAVIKANTANPYTILRIKALVKS